MPCLKGGREVATIKDVAKKAGVSVTAVSRALNNYPDINVNTKSRILKIVEELRYYPRASARNLVTRRSQLIGLYYPIINGVGLQQPYIGQILDQFKSCLGEHGYDLLIFSDADAPFAGLTLYDRVMYRDVDGLLILGLPDQSIQHLAEADLPVVGIDHFVQGKRCGSVTSDNRRAVHDLVKVLVGGGYRRLGFAHGPLELPVAMERLQGFYSGLAALGIAPNTDWIVDGDFTMEGGQRAGEEILRNRERPDVLICAADVSAIGAMQTFHRAGVRMPDEMSVVGFDDIDAASFVYPQLTTIRQNKEEIGRKAAEIMMTLIHNEKRDTPMHYVLPTELVVRQSTRPLPIF